MYGMPSFRLDGNDVVKIWEVAGDAVLRARAGEGPTLLEGYTYRTRAHSEGMRDAGYRTREDVEEWKGRDPIKRLRLRIMDDRVATGADLDKIDADTQVTMDEAVEFGKNSPWPDGSTSTEHIFAE